MAAHLLSSSLDGPHMPGITHHHLYLDKHIYHCQGLVMGILGPSQPYLAHTVGVTNKEINLVWTAMTGGSCLATIAVGAVFNVRVTPSSKIPLLCVTF